MNNKKYKQWVSKDWTAYNIKDMSDAHIRNCIYMIVRSFTPEDNKDNKEMFNYDWTMKHGLKYIRSFSKELRKRRLV